MIAPGLILTAGHCMPRNANDIQGRNTIRLAGNKFNTGNGYQVEVACCGSGLPSMNLEATGGVTHPDYEYIANDLALVFVKPASGGGDAASIPAAYSVCPTANSSVPSRSAAV